jgi:hypothetical protein
VGGRGMNQPTCPRCGLPDQVRPVDHVVASHRGPLAFELAAPPPPGTRPASRRPGRARRLATWLLVTLLPLDLVLLLVFAAFAIAIAVVVGAVSLAVLTVYLVYRLLNREAIAHRKRLERAAEAAFRDRYQRALTYWYQLRFCGRCRGVFLPGRAGGLTAPAHAWWLAQQLAEPGDGSHASRAVSGG